MDQIEKELFSALEEQAAYEMAKDLSRGIFWVLAETEDGINKQNILSFPIYCDLDGNPQDEYSFNAKSGQTYNHEATWKQLPKSVTKGHPFNYYPRGRVELKNGKATIWLNGNILHLADDIKNLFGLWQVKNLQVREDGSSHYRCHFDD